MEVILHHLGIATWLQHAGGPLSWHDGPTREHTKGSLYKMAIRWPSLDRVFVVDRLYWTQCEDDVKLRGMKRLGGHTSSCVQVPLHQSSQVLAECYEAKQQENGIR